MKVRLHIESIVLNGLALGPHQESALRAALQTALAERFTGREKFAAANTRRLAAGEPELASQTDLLARQLARAIHRSLPRHAE